MVAVAHEAFLSTWPPLAEAITTHATALRVRTSVDQAAGEWAKAGHPSAGLWEGGQLAGALSGMGVRLSRRVPADGRVSRLRWSPWPGLVVPAQVPVTAAAQEFLRASVRRDTIKRGRAAAVLAVLLVAALVGAGFAVDGRLAAEEQQRIATARRLLAEADGVRDAHPRTALRLNLAAEAVHPDPDTRAALVDALLPGRFTSRIPGAVRAVAFAGNVLASAGDDTVTLWDVADPARPRQQGPPLACRQGGVTAVATDRNATLMATAGVDRTVVVWELGAVPRERARIPTGHTDTLLSLALSPDGRTLAVGSADHRVTVWDLERPDAPAQTLTNHFSEVDTVAFAPAGTVLVTGGRDSVALLWDLRDRARPQRVGVPIRLPAVITATAFSPDGQTLALALADGTARLWNVADPADPRPIGEPLPGHSDRATTLAYSADGRLLAVGSADATTTLWEVDTPAAPRRLPPLLAGHEGAVLAVAFAPTGPVLASAGADRSIALWDLDDPLRPRRLDPAAPHPGGVQAVAFAGATLAATRIDGAVSSWDTAASPPPVRDTVVGATAVTALAGAPSGRLLAAGTDDGQVTLWSAPDARLVGSVPDTSGTTIWGVAFSPDTSCSPPPGPTGARGSGTSRRRTRRAPSASRPRRATGCWPPRSHPTGPCSPRRA